MITQRLGMVAKIAYKGGVTETMVIDAWGGAAEELLRSGRAATYAKR